MERLKSVAVYDYRFLCVEFDRNTGLPFDWRDHPNGVVFDGSFLAVDFNLIFETHNRFTAVFADGDQFHPAQDSGGLSNMAVI